MADVLDYAALSPSARLPAPAHLARKIPDERIRRDILAYRCERTAVGATAYRLDEDTIKRLVGKYWEALAVLGELAEHISHLKAGRPFDLDFTIDEHRPEVGAFECLTTAAEALFVLRVRNGTGHLLEAKSLNSMVGGFNS